MTDKTKLNQKKDVNEMTPIEMVKRYSKIIELKKMVEDEYKELRQRLLEVTKETGVVSLKTDDFTITRQSRTYTRIENHEAAIVSLKEMDIPVQTKVVLDEDIMKPVLKNLAEKGEVVPGIKTYETEFVTVRSRKK